MTVLPGSSAQVATTIAVLLVFAGVPSCNSVPVLQTPTIRVDDDGSYYVFLGQEEEAAPEREGVQTVQWLSSVAPRLRNGSGWLAPMRAHLTTERPTSGSDALGAFRSVSFAWAVAGGGVSTGWVTSVRAYESGTVVFGQNFTKAIVTDGRLGADTPLSWWPAFSAGASPALGYLGFTGCMSGHATSGKLQQSQQQPLPMSQETGGLLKLSACEASPSKAQQWTFIEGGMVKNEGVQECLQLSHCGTSTSTVVAANTPCKKASMCDGANLGWKYFHSNASLMSTLSWMCLTNTNGKVSQAPCKALSTQIFYHDNMTRHLGPSSSPNPVPTLCLEALGGSDPHHPPHSNNQNADWGGHEAGPLALFDAASRVKILSPLTEHMSSVMNRDTEAAIVVGVMGSVENVPAGHSMQTILYSAPTSVGIRDSYEAWGDLVMAWHGKTRTSLDHDVFVSHLGYSTTSFYFYNQCDCGYHWPRQCAATDHSKTGTDNTPPRILSGCRNYEE